MHAVFIPYGKRSEVELLLRDMDAQKHYIPMWKGKKKKGIWIQSQVRLLPFGVYEYIFPKEDMDIVLTTLKFNEVKYDLGIIKTTLIKKALKVKKIPEFKKERKYLWIKDNVNIIPLGIREDVNIIDSTPGENFGWEHEAI